MASHVRYLAVLFCAMLTGTSIVAGLNFRISAIGWASSDVAEAAAQWQRSTHGIVNIAVAQEPNFRILSLRDRLKDVDTVILGASTMQSIRAQFLLPRTAYNFATSANPTASAVAQAQYLADRAPGVEWLVVGLDWAIIGMVYNPQAPPPVASVMTIRQITVADQLRDAVTLPRFLGLETLIGEWARASSPAMAVADTLTSAIGDPYVCAEGVPGRNFAADDPTHCNGIRWDGSETFLARAPFDDRHYRVALQAKLQRDSEYVETVLSGRGSPNPVYLRRLAEVAATLRSRGGGMIVLLPPLLPGVEQALLRNALTGDYIRQTKSTLQTWAQAAGIHLIDVGSSEKFGCKFSDFFDGHHNFGKCYERIFSDGEYVRQQLGSFLR